MTASKERPSLTFAAETSPSEATMRAIESGLTVHATGLGLRTDWSPRWIIGRDRDEVVQAGIRFVLAFEWLFVNWLWVADPYRKNGGRLGADGWRGSGRTGAGLSRRLSGHIHVSGAEVLRAARLSGVRPAQ